MYALVWFIIFGTYAGLLLLFGLVAYWGWKSKTTWLTLFGGVPAAGLIGIGAVFVVASVIGYIVSSVPSNVFKETFGEPPSTTISDLKADSSSFGDSGGVYLRFRTTKDEFKRLVPEGLEHVQSERIDNHNIADIYPGTPDWWTNRVTPQWVYYLRDRTSRDTRLNKKGYSNETEYFAFDPATNTAYYHFRGID